MIELLNRYSDFQKKFLLFIPVILCTESFSANDTWIMNFCSSL